MNAMVKHIGLQVIETDITNFYESVFGFKSSKSFSLGCNESKEIFGINTDVTIILGACGEVELELFVSKNPKQLNYNHVCLMVNNAEQLAEHAAQKDYRVFTRENKQGFTYFISDSNSNIFEIKNIQ